MVVLRTSSAGTLLSSAAIFHAIIWTGCVALFPASIDIVLPTIHVARVVARFLARHRPVHIASIITWHWTVHVAARILRARRFAVHSAIVHRAIIAAPCTNHVMAVKISRPRSGRD